MYRTILVPLDGSKLAECVLPHAEAIAKGCATSTIIFVRAIEPVTPPLAAMETGTVAQWQRMEAQNRAEAEVYMRAIAATIKYPGVQVKWEMLPPGRPADMIVDYGTRNGADLIIIATHGRSGISRWVMGSVADKVLRSACMPVLMVRAPGCVSGV